MSNPLVYAAVDALCDDPSWVHDNGAVDTEAVAYIVLAAAEAAAHGVDHYLDCAAHSEGMPCCLDICKP